MKEKKTLSMFKLIREILIDSFLIICVIALLCLISNNKEAIFGLKDYDTDCHIDSTKLAEKMSKEGYDVKVVKGWVSHAWVECYNCVEDGTIKWFEGDGTIIYDYDSYIRDDD